MIGRITIGLLCISLAVSVVSCDTAGNIEPPNEHFFIKYFGNDGNQEGVDMVQLADGTFVLFGNTDSPDLLQQLYLAGADAEGNLLWEKTYGDEFNEFARDIELTTNGELVIVADTETSLGGTHDILIMTLTLDGNEIANAKFGQPTTDETATSVTQTTDGFIIAGSTDDLALKPVSSSGPVANDTRDALHVRYFNDLTIYPDSWRKAHGPGSFDSGTKVIQIAQDLFYFFGYSDTQTIGDENFYVLKLGEFGETSGADDFLKGKSGSNELLTSVIASPLQSGEGFLLTGISKGNNTNDIYLIKLRKTLGLTDSDIQFEVNLQAGLGTIIDNNTAAYALKSSGFLIGSNAEIEGTQKMLLTKVDNNGSVVWDTPIIFGGEKDDQIGSVLEMPDGSIGIIGTLAIGQDGEKKMAFIKVNKDGKFLK